MVCGSKWLLRARTRKRLNRFRRFEYEAEYEYREAEYEKAELLPTKIPEELVKAVTIAFAGFALSDIH